jgi:hypothetical protein
MLCFLQSLWLITSIPIIRRGRSQGMMGFGVVDGHLAAHLADSMFSAINSQQLGVTRIPCQMPVGSMRNLQ